MRRALLALAVAAGCCRPTSQAWQAPAPSAAPAPAQPAACGLADDVAAIRAAQGALNAIHGRKSPPQEIGCEHAVLAVPTDPLAAGDGFAAEVFAALPRTVIDDNFTTTFTKFVVVGHSRAGLAQLEERKEGISMGDDVCGGGGFADAAAVTFLSTTVLQRLKHLAPNVWNCRAEPGACLEGMSQGLNNQLPFLGALLGEGQSLRGRLLPVMMQGQDTGLAARLADALALLVQPGAVWEAERVLFVFAGDLSQGLPASQEGACDQRIAELLVKSGVPQTATYLDGLREGQLEDGCQGPAALPVGYGPLLAAAGLAAQLQLPQRRALVAHAGLAGQKNQRVHGFGAFLYWKDNRSVWARLGARRGRRATLLGGAPAALRHRARSAVAA